MPKRRVTPALPLLAHCAHERLKNKLDGGPTQGACAELGGAVTIVAAIGLGTPISTTHTAGGYRWRRSGAGDLIGAVRRGGQDRPHLGADLASMRRYGSPAVRPRGDFMIYRGRGRSDCNAAL